MYKHTSVAYFLFFIGSWLGLHHLYLNRPRCAFLHVITFNCCGIAWLRDLFEIPAYVLEVNATQDVESAREYVKRVKREDKKHCGPARTWLIFVMQIFIGQFFGFVLSCILPKRFPPISYELLFACGGAFGIHFAGTSFDHRVEASFQMILVAMIIMILIAFAGYNQDPQNSLYRSSKSQLVFIGCGIYLFTRRWSSQVNEMLQDQEVQEQEEEKIDTFKRSRPTFFKSLFLYWSYIITFFLMSGIGLYFHGEIEITVNGVSQNQPFYEALDNILHSDGFQDLGNTLYFLCYGQNEMFEERWQQFQTDMDVSGEYRHLQVLGLERGASAKEIKAAYRQLVLQWHPDKYKGEDRDQANRQFYKIQYAYEKLIGNNHDEL